MSDYRIFFEQFLKNTHSTGAISPSSRWLAGALCRYVGRSQRPQRILEVGPGTGAVTRSIVKILGPNDYLDLVELNDSFVKALRRRFQDDAAFRRVAARSQVIHSNVEELPDSHKYDLIISGLPFNNFAVSDVKRILEAYARLLKPGGTLSFFEYIAVRPSRSLVSNPLERQRLKGVGGHLRQVLDSHSVRRDCVVSNLPPAWVHHLRFSEAERGLVSAI
jgi:phospholipid N-methyltransferase